MNVIVATFIISDSIVSKNKNFNTLLFKVTGILILLLAVGLLAQAAVFLSQADIAFAYWIYIST